MKLELGFRVWIRHNDTVLGDGLFQLLKGVSSCGSISHAAAQMKMSYRQAWGKIHRAEKAMGVRLVEAKAGGHLGGGTHLTPEGEDLLSRYARFREEVTRLVEESFFKHFQGSIWVGRNQ
ncbi:MAG: winged helix-turn-helix domain-containing protein [Bacillota bacterium]